MYTTVAVGVVLIFIGIFWNRYKNKCSQVYNWKIKIYDSCLGETRYRESKINLYTLRGCWLDLLLATFKPGTLYRDIKRGNRHTEFERYTCEVNILQNKQILLILNETLDISNVTLNLLPRDLSNQLTSFRYQFLDNNLPVTEFFELTINEGCW